MSDLKHLGKRTYSVRPKSKYETLLQIGVPWGIAEALSNYPSKRRLSPRKDYRNLLIFNELLRCSQNEIAAKRRVRRTHKRTYSVRPDSLSESLDPKSKQFSSASNNLTLTQHSNTFQNETTKDSGEFMARINIEDQFWLDVSEVAVKLGNQDVAIGMSIRFFRYAQEKHKAGKLIDEMDFSLRFNEALIPWFAKRVDGGIQAIGAEKHFGWLAQKIEAGSRGGKKSAKRPRDGQGRLLKSKIDPSDHQAETKLSQPSPSPSSSPSYSSSDSSSIKSSSSSAKKANAFIAGYCERFKIRWGDNPEILPKHAGIAKRISKNLSDEKIGLYLDAYFSMPDSWLVKTKHPIEAFEQRMNELVVFANSGTFTSRREANQADASVALHTQLQQIRSGEFK